MLQTTGDFAASQTLEYYTTSIGLDTLGPVGAVVGFALGAAVGYTVGYAVNQVIRPIVFDSLPSDSTVYNYGTNYGNAPMFGRPLITNYPMDYLYTSTNEIFFKWESPQSGDKITFSPIVSFTIPKEISNPSINDDFIYNTGPGNYNSNISFNLPVFTLSIS